MTVSRFFSTLALVALVMPTSRAQAQGGPPGGPPAGAQQRPTMGMRGGAGRGVGDDDPRRAMLERRLQERLNSIVKQRLNLTDEQTVRLREVASKTEDERRALRREELTARFAIRQEMQAGDRANEARVAELLEQLPRLERRRVDLLEREQRELARFLSPIQRARYFGLQDELRRGMQELQQRRLSAPEYAGARGPGRRRVVPPR